TNGKIYAVGGTENGTAVEEYDPSTNTWTSRASLATPRDSPAVVAASNGRVYVIGGRDGTSNLSQVQEYNPATNSWSSQIGLATGRYGLGAAVATNGKIYAIGGALGAFSFGGVTAATEEGTLGSVTPTVTP